MAAVIPQPKVFRNREMLFSINFYYFNLNQHFLSFMKRLYLFRYSKEGRGTGSGEGYKTAA